MTAAVLDKSARVQIEDPLNIYIEQDNAKTDAQLAASRARKANGQPASAIDGWTVAVKDNYCTADYRTTAASKILENFQPTYESTVTARLRAAGGIVNGKVNMDEFAMGSSTETSHFGPTLNRLWANFGPTLDQLWTDFGPTLDRLWTDLVRRSARGCAKIRTLGTLARGVVSGRQTGFDRGCDNCET